jgi:hypothetical protein
MKPGASYRRRLTISYSDMLGHELIGHEHWAQAPAATSTPQIANTPPPTALAAASVTKVEIRRKHALGVAGVTAVLCGTVPPRMRGLPTDTRSGARGDL